MAGRRVKRKATHSRRALAGALPALTFVGTFLVMLKLAALSVEASLAVAMAVSGVHVGALLSANPYSKR